MKKFIIAAAAVSLAATAAIAGHDGTGGHHGKHHGKMFEKVDTNKDGAISRDEQRAFGDRMFDKLDGDGNGVVTKLEAKAFHENKRAEWKARKAEREAAGEVAPVEKRARP